MTVKFKDVFNAFDFVSFGPMGDHQAFLNKETGETHLHSEIGDNFEELPEDLEDEKYIEIPHKNELNLGRNLVFKFAHQYLPDVAEEIESIFGRKGVYSNFKAILHTKGATDKWCEYESQQQEKALRNWCEKNQIEVSD